MVAALVDAAAKHNERNPDRAVIVLKHSSTEPDLTGKRCSFWHFQFEANTAMKMKAIANTITVIGPLRMRGEDHQLPLPQVVNTIAPVGGMTVKVGYEGTSWGLRTDAVYTGNELAQGTECKMVRP